MDLSPKGFARSAQRLAATIQNAAEVVRSGGLETDEESSPYDVVAQGPVYRLRRYFPADADADRSPVVLVPPLMLTAEVYDVSEATSAVRILDDAGLAPYVVDFGSPEHEEGGLKRTLTDHVLAVNEAIDHVRNLTRRDVHLGGYSQGGMFCYQTCAYRQNEGIASLITFGSPVDTRQAARPLGLLPEAAIVNGLSFLADNILERTALPGWMTREGFRLMDPVKSVRQRIEFIAQLHDREALLPRERQRRFLMGGEGFVAYPGPAVAELVRQFIQQNRMLRGGFVIGDRVATLADINCPVLCFVGEVDSIAAPAVVRAINRAAPAADVYEVSLRAGHFGLVVGGLSARKSWPTVANWVRWVEGGAQGEPPEHVEPLKEAAVDRVAGGAARVGSGLDLVAGVGLGVVRSTAAAARNLGFFVGEASQTLPRLSRLQHVEPDTKISIGALLDERARKSPDDTFFVFADRGHTYAAAKFRIDNVVRGLIAVGVRRGEHVGVLMDTRPSALALLAALNRLGAVVVLMRPDGSPQLEAELGQVQRIIADPEHADIASKVQLPVMVLGGGGDPRELGFGITDMERIDPHEVPLPGWYVPNPGRARDLAFIVFTGEGDRTRVSRITNGRWATSAFGTASAASLSKNDTVYSVTPIHHPSGLLTSVGGAIAGGSRVALATSFDPATFWQEVRRYGVTVVSYTWTLVHSLVEAPPSPAERHHPVRLFMGSGMPQWLWQRTVDRFRPARVLEFWASTEEDVVLVNVAGEKIGCKGRPLPGTADVVVARADLPARRLLEDADGFAEECAPNEVGMLLARLDSQRGLPVTRVLRGVFTAEDAWLATGALFRRDEDGDFWLIDHVADVVHTADGPAFSIPVTNALGALDEVSMVAVYGVPDTGEEEVVVAALQLRPDRTLSAESLAAAVGHLPPHSRPAFVRVVEQIPVDTWFKPVKREQRAEGLPTVGPGWALNFETGAYVALPEVE